MQPPPPRRGPVVGLRALVVLVVLFMAVGPALAATCMQFRDFQSLFYMWDGPWPRTAVNTCIESYGQCDPSSQLGPACACTCICPVGRGGFFCNETLAIAKAKAPFGFHRTFQRRHWVSSLMVNGTIGTQLPKLPGWTLEFWVMPTSGIRPLAGTTLFEFRAPKFPCNATACLNGRRFSLMPDTQPGFLYSMIAYLSDGSLTVVAEVKTNTSRTVNGVEYVEVANAIQGLSTLSPHHIAVTMRRALAISNSNDQIGEAVSVFDLYQDGEIATRFMIDHDTDFEKRPLHLGPWDNSRYYEGTYPRDTETSNTPVAFITEDDSQIYPHTSSFDAQFYDEFRFWGRSLRQNEIQTGSKTPLSGTENDLLVYWDFDDADRLRAANRAVKYASKWQGIHVIDDVHVRNDQVFWNDTSKTYPVSAAYESPMDPQPHWAPARNAFPDVPEAMHPVFEPSFVGVVPSTAPQVQTFRLTTRGMGNMTSPWAPPMYLVGHTMTAVGDVVYICGGLFDTAAFTIVSWLSLAEYTFDTNRNIWAVNATSGEWIDPGVNSTNYLNVGFALHSATLVDDRIYYFGKDDQQLKLMIFDTTKKTLQVLTNDTWDSVVLTFGHGHSAVPVGRKIYFFGGGFLSASSILPFSTLGVLDVDTLEIKFQTRGSTTQLWPVGRIGHWSVAHIWNNWVGFVVALGARGGRSSFDPATDAWFYNISSSSWTQFPIDPAYSTKDNLVYSALIPDNDNKRVISIGGIPYTDAVHELYDGNPIDAGTNWSPSQPTIRVFYIFEDKNVSSVKVSQVVPGADTNSWNPTSWQIFGHAAALYIKDGFYRLLGYGGITLYKRPTSDRYIPVLEGQMFDMLAGCRGGFGVASSTAKSCEPCRPSFSSLPLPGRGSCVSCQEGYFSPDSGTACRLCPAGTIRPTTSSPECTPCASGFKSSENRRECVVDDSVFTVSPAVQGVIGVLVILVIIGAAVGGFILFRRWKVQHDAEVRNRKLIGEALNEKEFNFSFLRYDDLQIGEELGSGSFGSVYKGTHKGQTVAIKVSKPGVMEGIRDFLREAEVMMQLTPHPNVLSLLGVCHHAGSALVVLEFVEGGSLDSFLRKGNRFHESDLKRMLFQVCSGLKHLHEHNLIHRDLAARNILLGKDPKTGDTVLKISDFGMSRIVEAENKRGQTVTQFGPVPWMAPEAIGELKYSPESDVWSLGVTFWEIVTGQDPSKQMPLVDLAVAIRDTGFHPRIPPFAPEWLRTIFDGCWRKNPDERISLDDAIRILGKTAEEDAIQKNKRKSTVAGAAATSGYITLDHEKKGKKDKAEKGKQEDIAAIVASMKDQLNEAERRLASAVERNNELRQALGKPPREQQSTENAFAPPPLSEPQQQFAPPPADGNNEQAPRRSGWRKSVVPAGMSNIAINKE